MGKQETYRIVIPSQTDRLHDVRKFISDLARQHGFQDDDINKITIAVDEACTNIIKHAYKYSPEGNIFISTKYDSHNFIVSITDEGKHFDPSQVPEPDLLQYQGQKRAGGLGMFLMKKLMDEVKYSTLTGNKNQVVLVKYIS